MTNHKYGIGKKGPYQQIAAEIGGLGAAEFLSGVASLGTFVLMDELAPDVMKSASKALSKTCIEPNLDWIERNLTKICHLDECKPDMSKPREERAENLARMMIKFSGAFVSSMGVKLASRKLINNGMGIDHESYKPRGNWFEDKLLYKWLTPHDWKVVLWDESVHLGSLVMVNNGVAKHTENAIHGVSGVLQKSLGWSKKKADETAAMGIIWEVPNLLGFAAGSGVIAADHLRRAKQSTSLSHGL